jgi:hypothetical protein
LGSKFSSSQYSVALFAARIFCPSGLTVIMGVCSQNRITFDSDVKLALRRRCGRREYRLASPRTSRAGVAWWRDQRLPRVAAFATLVTLRQVDCGPYESISNAV